MILRAASTAQDADFARDLWGRAQNAAYLAAPAQGEITQAIAAGLLMIGEVSGKPAAFALLTEWNHRVWGIPALAVEQQGKGHGTQFFDLVLRHVFQTRNAHRLGLDVTLDNAPARRLYARFGLQPEGIFRECWQRPDGEWVDCAFLGLLAREWHPR